MSTGGSLVGSAVLIENNTTNQLDPQVGNVNLRDAFLVVWTENSDIIGRAVPADSTLALTARANIAATTDLENEPDVGGEFGLSEDDALVVWDNDTANTIEACQVQITSTLTIGQVISRTTIRAGTNTKTYPTISKSGGQDGQFLICWAEYASSFYRIYGAVYDRNVLVTDSIVTIASDSTYDRLNPSCDGDGRRWVVAYKRDEAVSTVDQDIYVRSVYLESGVARVLSGEVGVENDIGDDENNPDVAWTGQSAVVVYDDETGTTFAARVESVNQYDCLYCEGVAVPDYRTTHRMQNMAIASRFSGGPFSSTTSAIDDDVLMAWEALDSTALTSDVLALRWTTRDGLVGDLGGGCGGGGDMRVSCAHSSGNFASRVFGANASANAWLILSPRTFNFPCGTCLLVPDPFVGIPLATTTNSVGTAEFEVYVPSGLNNGVFYAQWLVAGGSSCTNLGTDLSNAVRVTIQD